MQRDGPVLNMVLRIFLRVIAQSLQAHSPGAANADKAACTSAQSPSFTGSAPA
jgi:hypothetical protein